MRSHPRRRRKRKIHARIPTRHPDGFLLTCTDTEFEGQGTRGHAKRCQDNQARGSKIYQGFSHQAVHPARFGHRWYRGTLRQDSYRQRKMQLIVAIFCTTSLPPSARDPAPYLPPRRDRLNTRGKATIWISSPGIFGPPDGRRPAGNRFSWPHPSGPRS